MYHIIINPASRSGRGMHIWKLVLPILQERKVPYRAYFTQRMYHATQISAKLTASRARTITLIVLGGDGTLNEVIQGITDFSLAKIAYIPTGSSNDLARSLHLETKPVKALLRILNDARVTSHDLGIVTYFSDGKELTQKRLFCVSSGIGFDAAVCAHALTSPVKDFLNHIGLGKLTYLGIALRLLCSAKPASCDLISEDFDLLHHDKFLFIACMIQKYEGGGFMFCPDADDSDGLLDLCIAESPSFLRVLHILPTAFHGNHTRFREITMCRAKSVHIKTGAPLYIHTDGEVSVTADEIMVSVSEHRLRLLC